MQKIKISLMTLLVLLFCVFGATQVWAAEQTPGVVINYMPVIFNVETGYPFVDENNRTMVPLRGAMEAMGAVVGWDEAKQTAIVIYNNDRIEVTIGEYYIYNNNVKIPNDTAAVSKNNHIYLPLKAVLESADFTVEFDSKTNTVNAYNYVPSNELVPYNTGSLETLVQRVLDGDVIYVNGQYYATPEHNALMHNIQMHYSGDDLNRAIYPETNNRYAVAEMIRAQAEAKENGQNQQLPQTNNEWFSMAELNQVGIVFSAFKAKGFYGNFGLTGLCLYEMPELPDDFLSNPTSGVYNGITIKVENGQIFFLAADLRAHLSEVE